MTHPTFAPVIRHAIIGSCGGSDPAVLFVGTHDEAVEAAHHMPNIDADIVRVIVMQYFEPEPEFTRE